MRSATKLSRKQRRSQENISGDETIQRKRGRPPRNTLETRMIAEQKASEVTPEQFKAATRHRIQSRLCGDLGSLAEHLATFQEPGSRCKHGNKCSWCGEIAWTKCTICDTALHFYPARGDYKGKDCAIHFHDEMCFGLGYRDHRDVHRKEKSTWVEPTRHARSKNRTGITALKKTL